jgi:hypothetical protein
VRTGDSDRSTGTGRVLEHRQLEQAYAPGILRDVRPAGQMELSFDFQGPRRLIVHERGKGLLQKRRLELFEPK